MVYNLFCTMPKVNNILNLTKCLQILMMILNEKMFDYIESIVWIVLKIYNKFYY